MHHLSELAPIQPLLCAPKKALFKLCENAVVFSCSCLCPPFPLLVSQRFVAVTKNSQPDPISESGKKWSCPTEHWKASADGRKGWVKKKLWPPSPFPTSNNKTFFSLSPFSENSLPGMQWGKDQWLYYSSRT